MNDSIINKNDITANAKLKWDRKSPHERAKKGSKYNRFAVACRVPTDGWVQDFDSLSKRQQNIVIKGELIRVYDSLPNISKTKIAKEYKLKEFASKWYKLSACDKKTLLKHVLE